jgi:hypothetical protein
MKKKKNKKKGACLLPQKATGSRARKPGSDTERMAPLGRRQRRRRRQTQSPETHPKTQDTGHKTVFFWLESTGPGTKMGRFEVPGDPYRTKPFLRSLS